MDTTKEQTEKEENMDPAEKKRRETWKEICIRNKDMHIKKYPHLKNEIGAFRTAGKQGKVLDHHILQKIFL